MNTFITLLFIPCQQTMAAHALNADFFSWLPYKKKHGPVWTVVVRKQNQ